MKKYFLSSLLATVFFALTGSAQTALVGSKWLFSESKGNAITFDLTFAEGGNATWKQTNGPNAGTFSWSGTPENLTVEGAFGLGSTLKMTGNITTGKLSYSSPWSSNGKSGTQTGEYNAKRDTWTSDIIYVNAHAKGTNNGINWQNAFKDLQSALDASITKSNASIWVAKGTYYPTKSENPADANPRTKVFLIGKNVKLMGGFDGTETMECQQDYADNETTLSGDIGALNNPMDNCYNVVKMQNLSDASLLSGFVITGGNGVGGTTFGGGLHIDGNGLRSKASNPIIEHCIFKKNQSKAGGAIWCNGEGKNVSPTILHCTFISNRATQFNGGAIYSTGRNGGASMPLYEDCVFYGNKAQTDGGAIFNDAYSGKIKSDFINCAFIGNEATRGGAIYNAGNAGSGQGFYKNCSFSGNKALADAAGKPAQGGAIMNEAIQGGNSVDAVLKCILYGNSSELGFNGTPVVRVDTSLIKGGAGNRGNGNKDQDPLFVQHPPIGLGIAGDLNLKHESSLAIENIGYHAHGWNSDVHWTYSEEELDGPQSWLHLCSSKPGPSSCGGSRQSPIDIMTTSVKNADSLRLSEAYEEHKISVVNNGHTLEFEADNDVLTLNGARYELKQFHFHTPSEHKINGKQYPMEVHFVHLDTATKLLSVLGVFFEVGTKEHPLLKTFINNLPGKADAKCDTDFEFSIESLLPENRDCYQYKGSLTTPPCSEIVNWNVFKTPVIATQAQIDAFKKRENINNRPTQALNGRTVYLGKLLSKIDCKTLNNYYATKNHKTWNDKDRNTAISLLNLDGTAVPVLQGYNNEMLYRLITTKCK